MSTMNLSKVIGGILLIIGTSIGGGLLALPMATAGGGFIHSLWLFLGAWLLTLFGAFYILEVNLWLPPHTNMVSMAQATLGKSGQVITWIVYLLLLYALLSAYIAGGSDLVGLYLKKIHFPFDHALSAPVFVIIFGSTIHLGIRTVDRANRLLMTIKTVAYVLLIVLTMPHVEFERLQQGTPRLLAGAVMVVVTSFGYATIIPSLRTYFSSDVNMLRWVIGVGSFIPLICYLLWDFAVQGAVDRSALLQMAHSENAVSNLTLALSGAQTHSVLSSTAHVFTAICVTTSFLGVGLCLWDFIADGYRIQRDASKSRWLVTLSTLLPPLLMVMFWPNIFVKALVYAGVLCVVLLMLMPGVMAWSGRYIKKTASGYQVWGNQWILSLEIVLSTGLALFGLWEVFR